MIGFSLLVFRRARSVGRHPWMWVLVLWLLTLVAGFIGSIIGVGFALRGATHELTDRELQSVVMLPTAIGMVVGVVISIWASGKVRRSAAEPGAASACNASESSHRT
jgi:hypothetical protein